MVKNGICVEADRGEETGVTWRDESGELNGVWAWCKCSGGSGEQKGRCPNDRGRCGGAWRYHG
jgi:hypothetical protein